MKDAITLWIFLKYFVYDFFYEVPIQKIHSYDLSHFYWTNNAFAEHCELGSLHPLKNHHHHFNHTTSLSD